jgi:hypothetical protein
MSDHMEQFLNYIDIHLSFLNNLRKNAIVLTDSNINLSSLDTNQSCVNYFNTLLAMVLSP